VSLEAEQGQCCEKRQNGGVNEVSQQQHQEFGRQRGEFLYQGLNTKSSESLNSQSNTKEAVKLLDLA
jgi:hypothetical protein